MNTAKALEQLSLAHQEKRQTIVEATLLNGNAYMEIMRVDNQYKVSVFGLNVATIEESQVDMVEAIIKNTLISAGVIKA